jgi:hypothetical protein
MSTFYQGSYYSTPVTATAVPMSSAPTAPIYSALPTHTCQNADNLREFLNQKGWPEAMQTTFIKNIEQVPLRYFICDDSGSMSTEDGTVLIEYKGNYR